MSHIVIHNNSDYVAQYRQFDDVQDAVTYLEQLHNTDGVKGARLFAMQEVPFEVKSYVKIELGSAGVVTPSAAPVSAPAPARAEAPVVAPEVIAPAEVAQEVETVSYIEASLASVDEAAPVAPARDVSESERGSADIRRGLFGR
jgi:hypothetical protein